MNTNVKLSENEMSLVCSSNFILTKNAVVLKATELFGEVNEVYKNKVKSCPSLPGKVFNISPKIYRGEKYRSLPYVLLDHPRFFDKENIFAVRSFFWWGNFFSISLLLKGKYFEDYFPKIFSKANNNWFFYGGNDIWENDFNENEYFLKKSLNENNFHQKGFLRMTKKIPLHEWNESMNFFEKNFEEILSMITGAG